MALADYQQLVMDMVSDQDRAVTSDVLGRAIEQARVRYSIDCPRSLVADVVFGDGQLADVPEGWTDGAWVQSAEYPIGREPLALIDVAPYLSPTGWRLMAADQLPADAQVRVTFTAAHELTPAADTIALAHRLPVAQYAAHLLCQQLASRYSGERESTVGADVARTESRARAYAARAKEYRAAYYQGTGQADPFAPAGSPASGQAAAAAVASWPGRQRYQLTRGVR